jgi:hypothetical protein
MQGTSSCSAWVQLLLHHTGLRVGHLLLVWYWLALPARACRQLPNRFAPAPGLATTAALLRPYRGLNLVFYLLQVFWHILTKLAYYRELTLRIDHMAAKGLLDPAALAAAAAAAGVSQHMLMHVLSCTHGSMHACMFAHLIWGLRSMLAHMAAARHDSWLQSIAVLQAYHKKITD